MSSAAARERWRANRTRFVREFCTTYGFKLESLNHGYQLRIEDVLDVYPTNGKWHWLLTGERGDWDSVDDLKGELLRLLPRQEVEVPPIKWPPEANGDMLLRTDGYVKPRPSEHFREGYKGTLYGIKTLNYPRWYHRLWHWIRRQPSE